MMMSCENVIPTNLKHNKPVLPKQMLKVNFNKQYIFQLIFEKISLIIQ